MRPYGPLTKIYGSGRTGGMNWGAGVWGVTTGRSVVFSGSENSFCNAGSLGVSVGGGREEF